MGGWTDQRLVECLTDMASLSNLLLDSDSTGTIVAMEKQSGILKEEHIKIIEEIRDSIEADLHQWRESH